MSRYSRYFFLCLPFWWIVSAQAGPELPIWAAASWRNDIATVRAHIAAGTNIDTLDDWTGKTALHYAAEYGHLEITELLLSNGANVNRRDDDKATPLHFAAMGGFEEVVVLLLSNGAEVNASDKAKERPMDGAVFFGHMNVVNVIKDHFIFKEFTLEPEYLELEVDAFKPGQYGFLRKKKLFGLRELQIMSSEDLIQWRTLKIFDTSKPPLIFRAKRTRTRDGRFKINHRFYRVEPYIEPSLISPNRIDIFYETYKANWMSPTNELLKGYIDLESNKLFQGNLVTNPGFEVVSEEQRAQMTYLSGWVSYAQFAEYDKGSWGGEKDHSVSISIGWRKEGVHLILEVEDDMHHHTKKEGEEGDAVKVLFADANRENVRGEYLFSLSELYEDTENGFLYSMDMLEDTVKGSRVGYAEQISGSGFFDVVMLRKQKTLYPNTGTTIYEMWFSPEAIGMESLKENDKFGLGVAVIDSDPDTPGLQGWSGWGPESVVLEANPGETALITLVGGPGDDSGDEDEGDGN